MIAFKVFHIPFLVREAQLKNTAMRHSCAIFSNTDRFHTELYLLYFREFDEYASLQQAKGKRARGNPRRDQTPRYSLWMISLISSGDSLQPFRRMKRSPRRLWMCTRRSMARVSDERDARLVLEGVVRCANSIQHAQDVLLCLQHALRDKIFKRLAIFMRAFKQLDVF